MDTSEQYINMCMKAKELQEMWEPATGDYCASSAGGCNRILVVIADPNNKFLVVAYPYATYDNTDHLLKQNIIWLPRIDQLIELSAMHWSDIVDYARLDYNENQLSFEITMLKIVVYMVYRKRWNGEDWI